MYQFTYEHSCTSVFALQTRARHRKSNLKAFVKHYGFIGIHIILSQTYFFEECFSKWFPNMSHAQTTFSKYLYEHAHTQTLVLS